MLSLPDFKQKQVIFVLLRDGEKVAFKNDNIVVLDAQGSIRHQSSCYRLFSLFIVGNYTLTSGILARSKKFGFSIFLLSYHLSPYCTLACITEGNVLLRQKQYERSGIEFGVLLVKNKVDQQLKNLQRRRSKNDSIRQAIEKIEKIVAKLDEQKITENTVLLGLEGSAARVYFSQMFDEMHWEKRVPRLKPDIINLLLDIGYHQLFNLVDSLLCSFGFDVYKGVYHTEFYQRKSLACDLIEPFRPVVDRGIRILYKRNQIKLSDFKKVNHQYRIFGKESHHYSGLLLQHLMAHKDDIYCYIRDYYRAFIRDKPIEQFPYYDSQVR